jgi:transposase-like protein
MDADKYSGRVSMQCSTCGGTAFEYESGDGPYRCKGCDRTFTRDELLWENGGRIESEVQEVKSDIVNDLRSELRNAFSTSKYIKFK